MKVDMSINDGEFTAHYDGVVKITIERIADLEGKLRSVETIEEIKRERH